MPVRRPADRNRLLRRVISRTLASVPGLSRIGSPDPTFVPDFGIEPLEVRRLLTTLAGAGMVNGIAQENNFIYRDADDHQVRISLRGNVLAEFIFLRVDGNGNNDGLLDDNSTRLVGQVPFLTGTNANTGQGADLFSVYVTQADADSSIVISAINATTGAMVPFTGNAGNIRYFDTRLGETDGEIPAGTGQIILGARTKALPGVDNGVNAGDVLILNRLNTAAIGVRPASLGRVFAGLEVAKGQKLGKFYFGGTATGRVKVADSMGEFYAGNIFTGEANANLINAGPVSQSGLLSSGLFGFDAPTDPGNFYVGGDLDQLLTIGNIGSTALDAGDALPEETVGFKSGFSGRIGGRLGSINAKGSIVGGLTVLSSNAVRTRGLAQREIEQRTPIFAGQSFFQGISGGQAVNARDIPPSLSDQGLFFNDSIDTAQYLGTFYNKALKSTNAIQVTGNIGVGESVDYYSVPLMAGQTVNAQVFSQLLDINGDPIQLYSLGIFDPDGRLILSDVSNNGNATAGAFLGSKMQFTADRPGLYSFAVTLSGNSSFGADVVSGGQDPYELRIGNVGALSIGTIAARGAIGTFDTPPGSITGVPRSLALESLGFEVRGGDFGAIVSTGSAIFSTTSPYSVRKGSLRAIQATQIGTTNNTRAPDLIVPNGNVGLVRTTGGVLGLNPSFSDLSAGLFDDFDPNRAIGGSYQLVDSSANLTANLGAKKGIGVIRAASVGAPRWSVNTDNSGNDGIIDLVYVTGDLGTLGGGGPQISTGDGGNVRYMRVLGTVYRDAFFGGGNPDTITSVQGRTVRLTDDSGTQFDLIPPPDPDGTFGTLGTPGTITATIYGIRDKGGSVLLDVTASAASGALTNGFGTVIGAGGLTVRSLALGKRGSVEIGNILVNGSGSSTDYNHATRTFTTTTGVSDDLRFTGSTPIDVFQITANGPGATLGKVMNETTGELVNVNASSINTIEAQQLAIAKSRTGTEVGGRAVATLFPFSTTTRNMINVTNNIAVLRSRRGLGAVRVGTVDVFGHTVISGNIGQVRPDSDGKHESGYFEGIDAPIFATGDLVDVNIGEGMLGGLGSSFSASGLYAGQLIGSITNEGLGSDIRGDIVVQAANSGPGTDPVTGLPNGLAQGGLDKINLKDGAIINAEIIVGFTVPPTVNPNDVANDTAPVGLVLSDFGTSPEAPTFDIGSINLSGKGGILSSSITSNDVGLIRISGGFGFINSQFVSTGVSNHAGIVTDGYGVRNSQIGSAFLGTIQANGNGKLLYTTDFTPSVRVSENTSVDPMTGLAPTIANDLHLFLGTTKLRPRRSDSSEAGVIADSVFIGQRDLGRIDAWRIRGHQPDPAIPIPVRSTSFPMRISFGNSIGTIRVREKIDGLNLTSGSIKLLQTGNDMGNTYVSSAGKITDVVVKGSILSSSTINASGPDGRIDTIQIGKRLVGRVQTSLDIRNLLVGTDLFSRQVVVGRNLYKLSVAGDVKTGTNVKVGDLLSSLVVGDDIEAGATITTHRLGTQSIGGELDGDLVVG